MTNLPPSLSSKTSLTPSKKALVTGLVLISCVTIISIFVWFILALATPLNAKDSNQRVIKITQNSNLYQIGYQLEEENLISSAWLFALYAKLGPSRGSLQPGTYLLSANMSIVGIADTIGQGKTATRKVTFQEGLNINEMAHRWAKAGLGGADSFIQATKQQYNQDFLKYRRSQESLEGYLFPSTYNFLIVDPASEHINAMLNNFADQVLPQLPQEFINSPKLDEIITIASIVEKEARTTNDRKLVASVIYNRLAAGMKLESDVTINYITGKTKTDAEDLKIDSPYNSYLYHGLPPSPITNPGLDSILSTVYPAKSDFLFFLADRRGELHFSKTFQEHEQNINIYLK